MRIFRRRDRTPGSVPELVEALLDPPARLGGLEHIVGPIGLSFDDADRENTGFLLRPAGGAGSDFSPLIRRLSVRYAWDVHHQDPRRPRDPELVEWSLQLRAQAGAVEGVLERRFSPGGHVAEQHITGDGRTMETRWAVYGPFFVDGQHHGLTDLRWYRTTPRFAMPQPDGDERRRWLDALREGLERHDTAEGLLAATPEPQASVGAAIARTGAGVQVAFTPPAPAEDVVDRFGWGAAVGVSRDVHLSSWHIERAGTPGAPTVGRWAVRARLSQGPSGAQALSPRGSCIARALAPGDEVAGLQMDALPAPPPDSPR